MKSTLLLRLTILSIFFIPSFIFAQSGTATENIKYYVIKDGISIGSVIAIVASWSRNQSILWAILHGVFSWVYVVYYAFTRTPEERKGYKS